MRPIPVSSRGAMKRGLPVRTGSQSAALVGAVLLAVPLASAADAGGPYAVDTLTRPPIYADMRLSPDGTKAAAITRQPGRANLIVIDLKTRTSKVVTNFTRFDIAQYWWVNARRACFIAADFSVGTGVTAYTGTFCVDADGGRFTDLTYVGLRPAASGAQARGVPRFLTPLAPVGADSDEFYVSCECRARGSADVYRVDTHTGRMELVTVRSPGSVVQWVLDRNKVARVAVRVEEREGEEPFRRRTVWHRTDENAAWEQIFEYRWSFNAPLGEAVSPIAFDFDHRTLYVSGHFGGDKRGIYRYDTVTKEVGDKVLEHPLIDLTGGLVFDDVGKSLAGVRVNAERSYTHWMSPMTKELQARVDAALPDRVNSFALPGANRPVVLVESRSDTVPPEYYLFDTIRATLEPLGSTRPWLDPAQMPTRRYAGYRARDGRAIPAWLTLPPHAGNRPLPLVVHIHGGPHVRAYGDNPWSTPQLESIALALQGYAVLEPEPRGSTGFGRLHYESSFGQWGQAMQDDITDGALALVAAGAVDRDRICLFGGSYGGYATLQGLVREPQLFRCGVAAVAVTDLTLLQDVSWSDIARRGDTLDHDFGLVVGDSRRDAEMFRRNSPLHNVETISAPVLLAMGARDQRVPLIHADRFVARMREQGKVLEYVVYPDEGHGFRAEASKLDFWRRTSRFLAEHLSAAPARGRSR